MHLANVAQGTVNWLHATGFLFRDDPSDQRSEFAYRYALSPRAFEALQLTLPDALRKNGDELEAKVDSKVEEVAMAAGKGFATEAGKRASVIRDQLGCWRRGGKGLVVQVADHQEPLHPRPAAPDASPLSGCHRRRHCRRDGRAAQTTQRVRHVRDPRRIVSQAGAAYWPHRHHRSASISEAAHRQAQPREHHRQG